VLKPDLADMPGGLRAVFDAAGTFELGYLEPDSAICMHAVSALASMYCALGDLRRIPLLVTSFG
jgi:hypothetical protein